MEMLKRKLFINFSPKLISKSNPAPQCNFPSRVSNLALRFFSTNSQSTLTDRVGAARDPRASIVPILDQWVSEGNTVEKPLLQSLVRLMKDYRRFNHALEISHWMTDRRYFVLSPSDAAIRLELIDRVYGSRKAEMYFEELSGKLKIYNVYGALLDIYARENSVQKAEAILQEMREKEMIRSSFAYNIMINLYRQNENFEKINALTKEMERNGIPQDRYTIQNLMAAYAAAADISGMEIILDKLEKDPRVEQSWNMYATAASGYLKVGSIEKALTMLAKVEKLMPPGKNTLAFNFLLSLYAEAGKKDELYRIWFKYKPFVEEKVTHICTMVTSLAKLDDIEGAEKIFEEWESKCTTYDFRVLNRLLAAYCRKGLLKKAEEAAEKAAQGRIPYASTWSVLAAGYIAHNQMSDAVEMLKRALSVSRKDWRPNPTTVTACLDYLEEQGDVRGMEEVVKLLKTTEPLTREIYKRLVRTYTSVGIPDDKVFDQMKIHDMDADEEAHKILEA
ncbi:pentatricopeptide repeat-containing protein At2g20710, mitochondrial-like [Mercurialis annua]|uniref:pentatricopeptide repeat-containing protein At2g20710, mitochondrial-like n=1 Tax=Mercurialis annua TaxID=3986 RepID=UPI00216068D8|nr:pentatricopeptide repeat-containing protein At2g20710, mitochondrial-like [Mercurialis annua]